MQSHPRLIPVATGVKCCLFFTVINLLVVAFVPWAIAEEAHEKAAHDFRRHHVGLILGNTQNDGSKHGLTVGLDYEYRLNRWLGLAGVVEYAGGDFKHWLLAVPLLFHPSEALRFWVGPGTEFYKEHEENEPAKKTRSWLVRTGVGYEFELGEHYTIAPEFSVDFSEEETLYAYGFVIGYDW